MVVFFFVFEGGVFYRRYFFFVVVLVRLFVWLNCILSVVSYYFLFLKSDEYYEFESRSVGGVDFILGCFRADFSGGGGVGEVLEESGFGRKKRSFL